MQMFSGLFGGKKPDNASPTPTKPNERQDPAPQKTNINAQPQNQGKTNPMQNFQPKGSTGLAGATRLTANQFVPETNAPPQKADMFGGMKLKKKDTINFAKDDPHRLPLDSDKSFDNTTPTTGTPVQTSTRTGGFGFIKGNLSSGNNDPYNPPLTVLPDTTNFSNVEDDGSVSRYRDANDSLPESEIIKNNMYDSQVSSNSSRSDNIIKHLNQANLEEKDGRSRADSQKTAGLFGGLNKKQQKASSHKSSEADKGPESTASYHQPISFDDLKKELGSIDNAPLPFPEYNNDKREETNESVKTDKPKTGTLFGNFRRKAEQTQQSNLIQNLYQEGDKNSPDKSRVPENQNVSFKPQPAKLESPVIEPERSPEKLQEELDSVKDRNREKIGDIIIQQQKLMQKKNDMDKEIANMKKKLVNYEKQLNEAAEKENYEEADRLETIIKQLKANLKTLESDSENCYSQYNEFESEKQQLYSSEEALIDDFIKMLERLLIKKTDEMDRYQESSLTVQRNDRTYIEEESEKLKLNKNTLDMDFKHIEEQARAVNENLEKQTKEYNEEGRQLSDRKQDLEETIARIKEELRQKENELKDVSQSLDSITTKVGNIKQKFQGSLDGIKQKKEAILLNEREYEKDMKHLNGYKETSEKNTKVYSQNIEKYKNMMENMRKMKFEFRKDVQTITEQNRKRDLYLKMYSESLNELKSGRLAIITCEEDIENLSLKIKSLQSEIFDCNSKKNSALLKIPSLEKEKKDFAAQRLFKDAQKVSETIKEVQGQIDSFDREAAEKNDQEKSLSLSLSTLQNETMPHLKHKLHKLKEQHDQDKYNLLLIKEKDLKSIHEHYVAQRQFEDSNTIESELKQCQQEIVSLKSELKSDDAKKSPRNDEASPVTKAQSPREETKVEETPVSAQAEEIKDVEADEKEEPKDDTTSTENVVVEDEKPIEITEEMKRTKVTSLVSQIEELEANVNELNKKIDDYSANDQFEEAAQANEELENYNKKKEELLEELKGLNFEDISSAKAYISQESFVQITQDTEQAESN
jgi:outer membrane murein-binding lipoprotein Lpp